jgi:hypothetical protein
MTRGIFCINYRNELHRYGPYPATDEMLPHGSQTLTNERRGEQKQIRQA